MKPSNMSFFVFVCIITTRKNYQKFQKKITIFNYFSIFVMVIYFENREFLNLYTLPPKSLSLNTTTLLQTTYWTEFQNVLKENNQIDVLRIDFTLI